MDDQQYIQYDEQETQILSKFLLDSKHLIDNISHTLLGEVLSEEKIQHNGRTILVPLWKPLENTNPPINKIGYYATLTKLQPLLDKISCSGFISEEEANLYTRMNMDTLSELYVINFDKFQFRSVSEMDAILDTILTLIKLQLSKSVDGSLIKELLTMHSINETLNQDKQDKKQTGLVM